MRRAGHEEKKETKRGGREEERPAGCLAFSLFLSLSEVYPWGYEHRRGAEEKNEEARFADTSSSPRNQPHRWTGFMKRNKKPKKRSRMAHNTERKRDMRKRERQGSTHPVPGGCTETRDSLQRLARVFPGVSNRT